MAAGYVRERRRLMKAPQCLAGFAMTPGLVEAANFARGAYSGGRRDCRAALGAAGAWGVGAEVVAAAGAQAGR